MDATDRAFCIGWQLGVDYLKRDLPCEKLHVSPTFKFVFNYLVTFSNIH